jgi:hypothetical protein
MKLPTILKNLTVLDWVLIVAFILMLAWLGQTFVPRYGWAIGIAAALFLLYLAKSRRDKLNGQ